MRREARTSNLPRRAAQVARRITQTPFDPLWKFSPPLYPWKQLSSLADRVWRERWIGTLNKHLYTGGINDQEAAEFVIWAIMRAKLNVPTRAWIDNSLPTPAMINWEALEPAYRESVERVSETYVLWPLQNGGGQNSVGNRYCWVTRCGSSPRNAVPTTCPGGRTMHWRNSTCGMPISRRASRSVANDMRPALT